MNKGTLFAVAVALAVALTGCAYSGPQSNTPVPTATPTPSAETSPESPAKPDHLVVSASGIQVVLDDGTIGEEFGFFDPIGPVAAALAGLFGEEPVVTTHEGIPSVDYDWSGLSIGTDGPAHPPTGPEIILHVTAAEVHGIGIETVDGIKVGDPLDSLEAASPSYRWQRNGVEELVIKVNSIPVTPEDDEKMFSVELRAHPSDGPVTEIGAPMKNWE